MHRKSLVWKLFPIYFLITFASVLVTGIAASIVLREFYYSQAETDLEVRTRTMRTEIESLKGADAEQLAAAVRALGRASATRITIIGTDGVVLADSARAASGMENHLDRPEVRAALKGHKGHNRRVSPSLGYTTVYLAMPIRDRREITGVIRTAVPARAFDAPPQIIYVHLLTGTLVIALISAIASLLAAGRISRPLAEVKSAAARFAAGDFKSRIPVPDTEELASLAETLNTMATRLDQQVGTITQQAGERQAILTSMKEGVVAIDEQDRLLIVNPTAEELLGVRAEAVKGKTIQEAVRNPDLQRILTSLGEAPGPVTEEITLHTHQPRLVEATGTALMTADGRRLGVLVVLNDVTQTRKLENIRRDFVANVSHELRTPITSIKGFVETLREGALQNPSEASEFLGIIAGQVDRLNAIIEDLLTLSRIEQEAEAHEIPMESGNVCSVLDSAVASCSQKATAADVSVSLECSPDLQAVMNAPLMEQAVTNLVDNAVKYSPGGSVRVSARREGNEIAIHVTDTGQGIDAEHIPRLFERFYRVDKARSRRVGGTGLGLAIVKHIVQAHKGRVGVESSPGQGSTFSIFLPA